MRDESFNVDPLTEHSFEMSALFEVLSMWEHFEVPVSLMRALTRAETLTEALDGVTAHLYESLQLERASVAISDGTGLLQIWAQTGASFARMDKSVSDSVGRIGRAFQTGQLVVSADLAICQEPDSVILNKSGYRRVINAPIIFAGSCIGTMNVCTKELHGLGLREAFSLQSIACLLAPILAALRQLGTSEDQVARAAALQRQAESESAAKSSFIAHVSHEIRTPMNAIMGMAQMLAADELAPQQAEKVEAMLYSANSLMTILDDVLDLSKIEAGKLEIAPLRNSPGEVLGRVVDVWQDRARQRGTTLKLFFQPGVPAVAIFDAVRVQQCVSNLISNAIKFTEKGDVRILVSARQVSDDTRFDVAVEDGGTGIDPEEMQRLFEPFRQGRGARGGTGLGLTISRRLAEMMGGALSATSQPGQGSRFVLSFVARSCEAGPALAMPDKAAARNTAKSPVLPQGLRILLVEDINTNRLVVQTMLQKLDVELTEVVNGQAALDILSQSSFDIILLDMNMPVLDGPGMIAAMRARDDAVGRLPVIALTADAMSGDRERYLKLGINGYLPKPIYKNDLIAEIARLVT